jgi:hypothetical protein
MEKSKRKEYDEIDLSDETKRDAFLVVQFNALRQEIELQIAERRRVEAQTFIGLAALYAWTFTSAAGIPHFYYLASLGVAVIFALLGLMRWAGIMVRTMTLGAYNHLIEKAIVGQAGGWEHFLSGFRSTRPIVGRLEGIAEAIAWVFVSLATIGFFLANLRPQ